MKNRTNFNIMKRLLALVKPLSGYMTIAVITGVVGFFCATFITVFATLALLGVVGGEQSFQPEIFFGLMIGCAVLRGFFRYAEQTCNHYIAFKLLALIRDHVFKALRRICPAKLEGRDKGDLISIITSDIELLEVFYAHTISPIMIAIIMSIGMSIYIATFNVLLGLLALIAYFVVGFVLPVVVSKRSPEVAEEFRTQSGKLSGFMLDSLRGLGETLQYANGKKRLEKIENQTISLSEKQSKMSKLMGENTAITNTIILGFDLAMLLLATILYGNELVSFNGLVISFVALMSSFGPVIALASLGSSLQNTFAAANRVLDILDETPVAEEIFGKEDIAFDGVKVTDVSFGYGEEQILKDFSVEIPKGQVCGIVGKSGSGKSTLLKLIMRFWRVDKGEISLSDVDIENINTKNLRDMESFVTQETHLFNDTIKNNLLIAKLDATDEEIYEASKKASIHNFIMSLSEGYDTKVGELGDSLSGGERQRIGLARAFLHNSDLMLLDEPTSNLDSLNEAIILKALAEEINDRTVILVSHRKSTMTIADKVYSVENGRMS